MIAIKEMDMPEKCAKCQFRIFDDYGDHEDKCFITGCIINPDSKDTYCPLQNKKYSEMYFLHNGDKVHFCPTCKYHLIDTKLNDTYCPSCGQSIRIRRPFLCKNITDCPVGKTVTSYCPVYKVNLDSDINGDAIISCQCDW